MYDIIAPRRDVWIRQTQALSALRAVVEGLGADRVLPVKGIVTARTLYADPSDRPIADVDIRVRPRDLGRVLAFAKAEGHLVRVRSRAYGTVVLDVLGVDVDVETTLGPPGFCRIDVETMLSRAAEGADILGFPVRVPETYDHALLLVLNVFKDKLSLTPAWAVEDLVRVAKVPGFDPDRMAARAREGGCATVTWIVADWLSRENEGWRAVREAIAHAPKRPRFVRRFQALAHGKPASLEARFVARGGPDEVVARARALVHALAFEVESRAARVVERLRARAC